MFLAPFHPVLLSLVPEIPPFLLGRLVPGDLLFLFQTSHLRPEGSGDLERLRFAPQSTHEGHQFKSLVYSRSRLRLLVSLYWSVMCVVPEEFVVYYHTNR